MAFRYLIGPYLIGLVATVFLACTPLRADESVSEQHREAIEQALELGEALYRYDQAAWHGTDAMLEAIGDPAQKGVRGWVVNEVEGGHEVVFYRPVETGFEAVWSGVYDGRQVLNEKIYIAGERALTEAESAKISAQRAPFAVETDYSLCSERLNQVVLPTGKEDGGFYVYLLAPQPALTSVPLGGHFRFEVVDNKVVDHRKFTNSCLNMPLQADENGNPASLVVSHLLDPVPTEIHVFSTYVAGVPIYVTTTQNSLLWVNEISSGQPRIRAVEP